MKLTLKFSFLENFVFDKLFILIKNQKKRQSIIHDHNK